MRLEARGGNLRAYSGNAMRAQRLLQHGLGALLHLDCLQGICFTYITSCTHTHKYITLCYMQGWIYKVCQTLIEAL